MRTFVVRGGGGGGGGSPMPATVNVAHDDEAQLMPTERAMMVVCPALSALAFPLAFIVAAAGVPLHHVGLKH